MTAAVYPKHGYPVPAGVGHGMRYAGTLMFMSDPSHRLDSYDVFHSHSNVGMGPFSQSYVHLGKLHEVYVVPPLSGQRSELCMREGDPRNRTIRQICGYDSPIHQIWAFGHPEKGLDLYVQTMGSNPPDIFSHYWVDVAVPSEWWRARSYTYVGDVSMPEWAAPPPRSAM